MYGQKNEPNYKKRIKSCHTIQHYSVGGVTQWLERWSAAASRLYLIYT